MKIEDKLIIAEIRKGNEEVFKHLYLEYHLPMLKFAEGFIYDRNACKDIVQSVFIWFWENSESLEKYISIKSYLYKSIQNRCLNYIRDLKVYDTHKVLFLEAVKNSDDSFFSSDLELSEEVKQALETLPPAMLDVFLAKYVEGKKISQIAEEFNVSENTIKTQLKRARKKMQHKLLESTTLKFIF